MPRKLVSNATQNRDQQLNSSKRSSTVKFVKRASKNNCGSNRIKGRLGVRNPEFKPERNPEPPFLPRNGPRIEKGILNYPEPRNLERNSAPNYERNAPSFENRISTYSERKHPQNLERKIINYSDVLSPHHTTDFDPIGTRASTQHMLRNLDPFGLGSVLGVHIDSLRTF